MKPLQFGTAALLAMASVIACQRDSQQEVRMQPASRTEAPPPPTQATSKVEAPQMEPSPPVAETESSTAPASDRAAGQEAMSDSTWGSSSDETQLMSPEAIAAADKIVAARCDRETFCRNIGLGKKYETRDGCDIAVHEETALSLNGEACKKGVESSQLAACVSELKQENCASQLRALEQLSTCRRAALCKP
jgi:hypothetical protein